MDQMGPVAGDGDFIQATLMIDLFSHLDGGFHGFQILDRLISLVVHENEFIQLIGVKLLEEAQMARIDTHKGDCRKVQLMDHTQELPITADADDQLRFRIEFVRNGEPGHFQLLFQNATSLFGQRRIVFKNIDDSSHTMYFPGAYLRPMHCRRLQQCFQLIDQALEGFHGLTDGFRLAHVHTGNFQQFHRIITFAGL